MTETQANAYSSERTQQELSNEYQHDRVKMFFKKSLCSYAFNESSLSIGRVKGVRGLVCTYLSGVTMSR